MSKGPAGAIAVFTLLLAAPHPAAAEARWEKGEAFFELSGSLRELGLYSKQTNLDDFIDAGIRWRRAQQDA